jgi:hypothetical protein
MSKFPPEPGEWLRSLLNVMRSTQALIILLILVAATALFVVGTTLPTEQAQRRAEGPQCTGSAACTAPLVCKGVYCAPQCETSRDCNNGWVCIDGTRRGDSAPEGVSYKICADPIMLPAQPVSAATDNIDFPGGDLVSFPVGSMSPRTCQTACEEYAYCQAYTYVKAGVQSATAYCYLKRSASKAVPNSCCISGVVRGAAPK